MDRDAMIAAYEQSLNAARLPGHPYKLVMSAAKARRYFSDGRSAARSAWLAKLGEHDLVQVCRREVTVLGDREPA
jgi:hypothetical protein